MARNNHQKERTSESARAGVREATDRAEDVMQTGIQAAQRAYGLASAIGTDGEQSIAESDQ